MNKRLLTICLVAVLTLSVICFASCKKDDSAERLRQINAALYYDYSKVELVIITNSDDVELNAKYVMTKSNGITDISYEVDRLNSFDTDGAIPSEFVTTVKGNATFNGSAITSVNGDAELYDLSLEVVNAKMTFRLSFLEDLKTSSNGITAKVTNPQGFWNDDEFAGTDMIIRVILRESNLSRIIIEYALDGATVKMDYSFTR